MTNFFLSSHRKMHKIVVTNRNTGLLNIVKEKLALEQPVNIVGKLNTIRFETDDGKHRSASTIMATEVYIISDVAVAKDSNNADSGVIVDLNSVELTGTITTAITGNKFRSFTLATPKYVEILFFFCIRKSNSFLCEIIIIHFFLIK